MEIKRYFTKKKEQQTNVVFIIIGLILIFIIGYAFWKSSKMKSLELDESVNEVKNIDELKKLLNQRTIELENTKMELEQLKVKRNKYFLIARLTLVALAISIFYCLQCVFNFEPYQKQHLTDNLRNYLSLIVICSSTVAFISKGSLNNFKQSIEEMATKWLFKYEEVTKLAVNKMDGEITIIKDRIKKLEIESSDLPSQICNCKCNLEVVSNSEYTI